jgi:hypothetical protein
MKTAATYIPFVKITKDDEKSVVCISKGPCFIFETNLTQTYLKWNGFLIEYV